MHRSDDHAADALLERLGHSEGFAWSSEGQEGKAPAQQASFPGEIDYGLLGRVTYCRIDAPAHVVERKIDNRGDLRWAKFLVQVSGTSCLSQHGRHVEISAGQYCRYDACRKFSIRNIGHIRQLVLLVPSDALPSRSGQRFEPITLLGARAGVGQVVGDFIRSVAVNLPHLTAARRVEIGEAMIAMLRLAYAEEHDRANSVSMGDTARNRAKAFIAFNLAVPELSVGMIAEALGYTKRHVHRLFEQDGMTIATYIRHERLGRCRDDLRDPAQSGQSITQIALGWGFGDSAYFSNAFKREFGLSPRAYRVSSGRD